MPASAPSPLDSTPDHFTIEARDGSLYEFSVAAGEVGGARDTKYGGAFKASHRHPDGSESSFYWNELDDRFQIASISLRPEMRNSGVGFELYKRVIDKALSQGKSFSSDSTVSSEALKIYPKLAALGYQIDYAPSEHVAAWAHQPRDELDVSRPAGSQQFMGRDERPIATVTGKKEGPSLVEPPMYVRELISKSASLARAPNPALERTGASASKSPERDQKGRASQDGSLGDWLVEINQSPVRRTSQQLKELIALGRLDESSLARPAEGGVWAPAGNDARLRGMIKASKEPRWSVGRERPDGSKESFGPYSDQQLCAYAAQGRIKSSDAAWAPGMDQWAPIDKTEAGEIARLGQANAQAFLPVVDIAAKLSEKARLAPALSSGPTARAPS